MYRYNNIINYSLYNYNLFFGVIIKTRPSRSWNEKNILRVANRRALLLLFFSPLPEVYISLYLIFIIIIFNKVLLQPVHAYTWFFFSLFARFLFSTAGTSAFCVPRFRRDTHIFIITRVVSERTHTVKMSSPSCIWKYNNNIVPYIIFPIYYNIVSGNVEKPFIFLFFSDLNCKTKHNITSVRANCDNNSNFFRSDNTTYYIQRGKSKKKKNCRSNA